MQGLLYMDLNIEPNVNQSGYEILFVEAKKVLGNIISIYFFQACRRAESSKSCNLISSESGRYFTILPANPAGIVGSSFKSLFVVCESAKTVIFKPFFSWNLRYY